MILFGAPLDLVHGKWGYHEGVHVRYKILKQSILFMKHKEVYKLMLQLCSALEEHVLTLLVLYLT